MTNLLPDASMKDILSEIASGLAGIRLLTVTDSDCMVLASWESPENKLSPEALGEFIQQINRIVDKFKEPSNGLSKLDDVVLGTSSGYMMIKPISNGSCFVVADVPRNVSLGLIRTAFANSVSRLEKAMPGHQAYPVVNSISLTVPEADRANKPVLPL